MKDDDDYHVPNLNYFNFHFYFHLIFKRISRHDHLLNVIYFHHSHYSKIDVTYRVDYYLPDEYFIVVFYVCNDIQVKWILNDEIFYR